MLDNEHIVLLKLEKMRRYATESLSNNIAYDYDTVCDMLDDAFNTMCKSAHKASKESDDHE